MSRSLLRISIAVVALGSLVVFMGGQSGSATKPLFDYHTGPLPVGAGNGISLSVANPTASAKTVTFSAHDQDGAPGLLIIPSDASEVVVAPGTSEAIIFSCPRPGNVLTPCKLSMSVTSNTKQLLLGGSWQQDSDFLHGITAGDIVVTPH